MSSFSSSSSYEAFDEDSNKMQVKKFLENSLGGLQIFKELIQNAEKAGASEVIFMLDLNKYPDQHLAHPSLAQYQGPALFCCNDALLNDKDWVEFAMQGNGFKSVFHLTELPSILSGDRLSILDPLQKTLDFSNHSFSFAKNFNVQSTHRHQLEPFLGVAGCSKTTFSNGFYNGTIFRLPLRNRPSQLSSILYSKEKVYNIFESFEKEAHLILLFVNNLTKLTLQEKDRSSLLPKTLFKTELAPSCVDEVKRKKMEFLNNVKFSKQKNCQITSSLEVTILTEKYTFPSSNPVRKTFNYLLTLHYDNTKALCISSLVPTVSTAMILNPFDNVQNNGYISIGNGLYNDGKNASGHANGYDENNDLDMRTPFKLGNDDGRLFSNVPLPLETNPFTGFPIHINGSFALDTNLKQVNWVTRSSPQFRAFTHPSPYPENFIRWNQMLMKTLLPACYSTMLSDAALLASSHPEQVSIRAVYRAFPDMQRLHASWKDTCTSVYTNLVDKTVFYCPLSRDWLCLKDCVFMSPDVTDDVVDAVNEVLMKGKVKVALCPEHVLHTLRTLMKHLMTFISPEMVSGVFSEIQHNNSFRWEVKMKLLRYFLKHSNLEHLDKLHLLPLANGGFDEFKFGHRRRIDDLIYVASDFDTYFIMDRYQDCMLEWEIEEDLKSVLKNLANRRSTQLSLLDPVTVCKLLPTCLPSGWVREGVYDKNASSFNINETFENFPIKWTHGMDGQPKENWLQAVWAFLTKNFPRDLSCVEHLPFIPFRSYEVTLEMRGEAQTSTITELIPMFNQVIICRNLENLQLDPNLEPALTGLNIWVIDDLPNYIRNHPVISKQNVVLSPSCVNILQALQLKSNLIGKNEFIKFFQSKLSPHHKSSLRCVFCNLPAFNIAPSSVQFLVTLPLFETLDESDIFVAASDVSIALTQAVTSNFSCCLPFKLSQRIVNCTRSETANLARLTGLKLLNIGQVLTQIVIPDLEKNIYDPETHQIIIHFLLENYETIVQFDPSFRKSLKNFKFLNKASKLYSIDRFYDPTIPLLQNMFLYEENFPHPLFTSPKIISVFKKLGLRDEKDVNAEDIKESALLIQQLSTVGNMENVLSGLQQKSAALLTYIQSHKHKLLLKCDGIQLSDILKKIKWVRSMDRPSSDSDLYFSSLFPTSHIVYPNSLPWFGGYDSQKEENIVFFSPTQMTLKTNILSCASTMPIIDSSSIDLVKNLSVISEPDILFVLKHLSHAISSYNSNQQKAFVNVVVAVYNILSNYQDQVQLRQLIQDILPSEWAWSGDGFIKPSDLVLNADLTFLRREQPSATVANRITSPIMFKSRLPSQKSIDLRPYVHVLPDEVQHLKGFFAKFGASEGLELSQVMMRIRNKYSEGKCFRATEVEEDLVLYAELIKRLVCQLAGVKSDTSNIEPKILSRSSSLNERSSDLKNMETFSFENIDRTGVTNFVIDMTQLYLPTIEADNSASFNRIKFQIVRDCAYVDGAPLMLARSFASEVLQEVKNQGLHLVHSSIPPHVCHFLKISLFPLNSPPPLQSTKLTSEVESNTSVQEANMNNKKDTQPFFTEPIKNLLKPFLSEVLSLPKEMIQNADDSGATEIRFLLDERTHVDAKSSLLDENMRHWQGPALWIYNDGVMTDDDFAEAFILSSASKQPNLEKIGRHGRGLCSVYAVTDVPSFVSKNWVVFFDPHMKYLGRSLKEKTKFGLRINLSRFKKQLSSLADQFKPYEGIFGWSTKNSDSNYLSTLFRLPLRNEVLALKSEIHQTQFKEEDVKNLFKIIFDNAQNLMLFTQNILKISCYHLSSKGSPLIDVCELFTVNKKGLKIIRELKPEIHLEPNSAISRVLNKESQKFVKQCSVLKASHLFMKQLLSRGNASTSQIPDSSTVISFDIKVFLSGEKILKLKTQQNSLPWLVVGCFGKDEVLNISAKCQDLLPYSGVAIPLQACGINKNHFIPLPFTEEHNGGCLFYFLPTSIKTGLPIHINGSFLTSEDHQSLKAETDMKSRDYVGWNDKLLSQVTSMAFINLLSDLSSLTPNDPSYSYPFYYAWPDAMLTSPEFIVLVKSFYRDVCKHPKSNSFPPLFFSAANKWHSFESIHFIDCGYEDESLIIAAETIGNKIMKQKNSSVVLVYLPKKVIYGFHLSDTLKLIQSKTFNQVQFFEKIFLPHISSIPERPRDLLMCEALKNIHNTPNMLSLLKNFHCILTGKTGFDQLEKPGKLVDPSSKISVLYRGSEANFPNKKYSNDENVLIGLKALGLKSEGNDMNWEEIIERCKQVQSIKSASLLQEYVYVLLDVINEKLNSEKDQSIFGFRQIQLVFQNIIFLPAKNKPEGFKLPWFKSRNNTLLYKPSELYHPCYTDILCCVQPILNDQLFPEFPGNVMNFLKLSDDQKFPMVAQIVDQLDAITTPSIEREMAKSATLMRNVQNVCFSCYSYLQNVCISNNKLQQQSIYELLQNRRFVLVDDYFLTCKQLSFSFTHDFPGFFHQLPEHYKNNYFDLFRFLGVGEHFSPKDFVEALKNIYDENKNRPLKREIFANTNKIVDLLKISLTSSGITFDEANKKYGPVYVPDNNGVLKSVNRLDNISPTKLPKQKIEKKVSYEEENTVNNQLKINASPLFNFEPIPSHPFSKISFPLELGSKDNNIVNEKTLLISRLRKVVCGKASDRDVLKEILRVADDIGSSKVTIIKDIQNHTLKNISNDDFQYFKHMQYQSLCVFLDRAMDYQQINNLLRTGHCSKGAPLFQADPNKSGLYGAGFDSVYKITDVPSIMSFNEGRPFICLFDPQGKILQETNKLQPGRIFDDVEKLEKLIHGISSCYLKDKFIPSNSTMIRIPLRGPQSVLSSELSDELLDEIFIDELFEKFKHEIFDCMLFLKEVNSVTLLENNNDFMKEIYTISVNTDESNIQAKREFNKCVETAIEEYKNKTIRLIDLPNHEITYPIMISDNLGQWEKWVLSHRFGLDATAEVPSLINENIKKYGMSLSLLGGVAAMLDSSADECHKRCSKFFTRLPLSQQIEMPVHLNGDFYVDKETSKYLWSDSDLGLMNDWNNLLMKYIIAPAYVAILSQVPSMLGNVKSGSGGCVYVGTIDSTDDEIPELDRFIKLFPIFNRQNPRGYLKLLIESVYKYIDLKQAAVIPVTKSLTSPENSLISSPINGSTEIQWFPTRVIGLKMPYFDNLKETYKEINDKLLNSPSSSSVSNSLSFFVPVSLNQNKKRRTRSHMKKKPYEVVRNTLINCGFKLAKLPITIFESFVDAGVNVSCITPKAVIDFFKNYKNSSSIVNIPQLPIEITRTPFKDEITLKIILDYCSQDIPYFRSNLADLPLLLCEDGLLKEFSKDRDKRVFLSTAYTISPGFESLFVHHALVGTVFKEADVEACDVFWRFDVRAFALHLPSILDRTYQVEPAVEREVFAKGSLKDLWLKDVWNFLAEEYQRTYEQTSFGSMQQHDEVEMARNLLNPISEWCLLPVLIRHGTKKQTIKSIPLNKNLILDYMNNNNEDELKEYLIPVNYSFMALDYSSESLSGNHIRKHFGRLGIFEFDINFFDENFSSNNATSTPNRCRSPALFKLRQTTPVASNQWLQINRIVSFIRIFVSTPDNPEAIIKPLENVLLKPVGSENKCLNFEESFAICSYFNNCIDVWKNDKYIINYLKSFPIHLSVDEKLRPIQIEEKTFLIKQNMPKNDMNIIQNKYKLNLLKKNPLFESLYELLGCHSINVEEVYKDFVFKSFESISPDARIQHWKFVKEKLIPSLDNSKRDIFTATIFKMKVIPDGQEPRILKRPVDIKDLSNSSNFASFSPAAPFNSAEWLEFFGRKTTKHYLVNESSIEVKETIESCEELLTMARQIALKGKKLASSEAKENAQFSQDALEDECQSLFKRLLNPKVVSKKGLFENLSSIAFIPAAKIPSSYDRLFPAYSAVTLSSNEALTTSWVTFKDCLPYKYIDCCWTCSYLLPSWADPVNDSKENKLDDLEIRRDVADRLGYNESPSIDMIVDHIQNISSSNQSQQTKSSSAVNEESIDSKLNFKNEVLKKIFFYLQNRIDDVVDQHLLNEISKSLHKLLNVKCIAAENGKFVAPRQVAINLYDDDQVPPYLYQAPSDLGQFKKVLLFCGASNLASPEQYAYALDNISHQTGGEKLHPNELRLTFTAVRGLFEALRRLRYKDVDPLSKVQWLYLPTVSGYMHRSTSLFFNDDQPSSIILRLQKSNDKNIVGKPFLVDLSECRLSSEEHVDLITLLPKRLQPIFLSRAVTEHLDGKCRESVVYHSIADKLKYQISSKMFCSGIIRLIKHEKSIKRYKNPVRQTFLDSIEQSLKKIRIQGVDKVVTYLALNGRPLRGTEAELESFAEKTAEDKEDLFGSEIWNIYINKLACFSEELQTSVSEAVDKMTGGLLRHSIHYVQPILSCLPHSIPKVLDKLAIKPDLPSYMQTSDTSNQPTLPTPGSLVPKEDHHLLKEDFEEFEQGEYIGYELEDEEGMEDGKRTIIYAIVLEKIVEEDFENSFGFSTSSPGPEKKRGHSNSYSIPSRSRSRAGHSMSSDPDYHKFTQKYRINVGEKRPPAVAPVTDLYKFHRAQGSRRWTSTASHDESHKQTTTPSSPYSPSSHIAANNSDEIHHHNDLENASNQHRKKAFSTSPRPPFTENNLFIDDEKDGTYFYDQSGCMDDNNHYQNEDSTSFSTHQQNDVDQHQFDEQQQYSYNQHQNQQNLCRYDEEWGSKNQHRVPKQKPEQRPTDSSSYNDQTNGDDVITTEKVMGEVSDALEEAWALPEAQRKKVVKRLLLRWHPDKNIGNEDFATVITQHVQAELERLELGLPRPSNFDPSQFDFDPRNPFSNSTSFKQNFANAYKYFFDQMNQRAKEHKQQRERYKENRDNSTSDSYFFQTTNPQPGQAKRFLRQAQEDLRAADNDFDALDPAYEWTCFKAHQAAEKALKAAQFAVDAVTSFSHDLVTLAASLEDTELRRLAQKLQKIVGNSNRLYNPDPMDFTVIPHEEFNKDMACDAIMCAVDILERVKEFVELRDL